MTAPQHPQRCDTCQHYQPYERWTGDCKILNHWLKTGEYELIAQVGCASHSSSPAAAPVPVRSMREDEDGHISWQRMNEKALAEHDEQIRQQAAAEEREKVLNEIMHWLEPQGLPLLKQRMWRQLESLRSGEGVQQR